jgi:hypothetical protein
MIIGSTYDSTLLFTKLLQYVELLQTQFYSGRNDLLCALEKVRMRGGTSDKGHEEVMRR